MEVCDCSVMDALTCERTIYSLILLSLFLLAARIFAVLLRPRALCLCVLSSFSHAICGFGACALRQPGRSNPSTVWSSVAAACLVSLSFLGLFLYPLAPRRSVSRAVRLAGLSLRAAGVFSLLSWPLRGSFHPLDFLSWCGAQNRGLVD